VNITEIMSAPIKSVTLDHFLKDVKEIFDHNDIRHLIVIEEGTLIGVVSERDLLKNMSPYMNSNVYTTRDIATLNQRVINILTRNPKFLTLGDQVQDAIALFNSVRIGCIPIVDENNVPVGIVTRGDIIRNFYKIKAEMSDVPVSVKSNTDSLKSNAGE
jgi:acetoin utilization protein AcuB